MLKKSIEIDVCSLCKGLWLTLDDVCPCHCKHCLINLNDSLDYFKEFNDYIECQVQLVRELLLDNSVMPGEKIKITYYIEPECIVTGQKAKN